MAAVRMSLDERRESIGEHPAPATRSARIESSGSLGNGGDAFVSLSLLPSRHIHLKLRVEMHISELGKRTGPTAKSIRYYERIGLLGEPERTDAGYRRYREKDVQQLRFIAITKGSGLTFDEIAAILEASSGPQIDCGRVRALLEGKLAEVKERLADIQALHDAVEHTIDAARRHELRAPAGEYGCPLVERVLKERTSKNGSARRNGHGARRHERPRGQ